MFDINKPYYGFGLYFISYVPSADGLKIKQVEQKQQRDVFSSLRVAAAYVQPTKGKTSWARTWHPGRRNQGSNEHRRPGRAPCRCRPSSLRGKHSPPRQASLCPIRALFTVARLTPGLFICFYSTNHHCQHYNHHRAMKSTYTRTTLSR